jgi:ABC-2 type transport system permease protein
LIYVRSDFNPLSGFDQSGLIQNVLRYNLVGGNQALTDRLSQPLNVTYVSLSTQPQRDSGSMLAFFLPYAVTMLLYIVIITSSSLMLSSITTEKQNRIIEILMVSVTPIQLLTGKIIALGLAGLLQTVVWGGAGFLLLQISGSSFNLPAAFMLPPSILLWGIVFFILGFTVYASLMAGVGALVPNLREASQATTIIILPMIIPLIFLSAIVDDPNGVISLVLSMFPLTAPIGMMSRLAAGVVVPLWQILIAAGLLVLTAVFIIRSVSQLFRAQTLLSGQEFSVGLFLRSLAGRE